MKRIIFVCEGQTEQQFCNETLYHHFLEHEILLEAPVIKRSKGGIVSWNILKKEINRYLKNDTSVYLTTFIDYYGIRKRHKFPKWEESYQIPDNHKPDRMAFLETAMLEDLDEDIRDRFIPYIQLHEFEGLLFSNPDIFDENFEPSEFADRAYLDKTLIV